MKARPILDEIWRVKDELAREANYDVRQLCANVRKWAAGLRHNGPVVSSAEELRAIMDEQRRSNASEALLMKDEQPKVADSSSAEGEGLSGHYKQREHE